MNGHDGDDIADLRMREEQHAIRRRRRRAMVRCTDTLLRALLQIPHSNELVGAEFNPRTGHLDLFFAGGTCPEVIEGAETRIVALAELQEPH